MNLLSKTLLGARAAVAFVKLVRDPSKLDEVFNILDSLEAGEDGQAIVKEFFGNPEHAEAFRRRPRIGSLDLDALARLPEGTLGRVFAEEMRARGLDPADIQMHHDDGTPAGFVFAHLRETHDVWHTATGFDVDVAGELGLQAFYLTQFRAKLSMLILSLGLLNTFFYATEDRTRRMDAIAHGWQMGRRSRALFGFDWAAHWATPLSEVRRKLGLDADAVPAPAPAGRAPEQIQAVA
jgi:ubiquinone biosynthesis protein Coq4